MDKKRFRYKEHARTPVKAEIVGEELERLIAKSNNQITPADIVKAAKSKKSPIHNCFEWDNTKAAKKYREDQARYLLRVIVVIYDDEDEDEIEVRLCQNIQTENDSFYTTTIKAMQDPEMSSYIELQALKELQACRSKYQTLKRFFEVWEAVDAL